MSVYNSIKQRREPKSPDEKLFPEHHDRAFTKVLKDAGLKVDKSGRKRDFVSLRHTYISNKILEKVPVYEIAHNVRSSVAMINQHYAWHLNPELFTSLHAKSNADVTEKIAGIAQAEEDIAMLKRGIVSKVKEVASLMEGKPAPEKPVKTGKGKVTIKLENQQTKEKKAELAEMFKEMADTLGMSVDDVINMVKGSVT